MDLNPVKQISVSEPATSAISPQARGNNGGQSHPLSHTAAQISFDGNILNHLAAAVYTCDATGKITYFNQKAVELWGRTPELGKESWCGSWKIFNPDGSPLPLEMCPMAVALREGRAVRNQEILVERQDGRRIPVLPHPEPLFDRAGKVTGAVNLLVDLTEVRRATNALRESERRQQQLMALMPAAVYTCDRDGRINYYNKRAAELWKQEPSTNNDHWKFCAAYKCWFNGQVIPPEKTPMARAVHDGETFRNLEPVFERPDGSRFNALVNIDPILDERGELAGAVNVFQDVTELKRVQHELERSQAKLRAVIENTPECIKLVDIDGTLLDMNAAGLELIEAPNVDAVTGACVFDLIAPEHRASFKRMNERVCSGEKADLQFEIIGLRGTRRWMETFAVPFWDEGRSRNVQLAITRDITDRRKTENALRESQERLRAALDASQTGTFYWDIITNQVDWDDALDALFGVTARESARSLSEFVERVHPEDRATVLSACERCAAAGADFDLEFRIIWPDGSVRWLHDRGRTFFSNGKRKYMAGACVDITHRKLGEAQLRAQKQALELIVRGRPLVEILETLTSSMEERLQRRCVASILLLQGERLYPAAGQSVPPEWSEYIRGMKIGAVSGSCGTAAHRKQAVIVTDILNDPLWASFRGEASKHGFRACWSVPILSSDNTVLGTLALYHFQPAAPTSNDIELVEVLARTAAVAIERKRHEELIHSREEALRQSEADFRLLAESMPQMVWTGRSDGYIDYANSKWCEFTGLSLEQTRGTGWAAALHPHDVERSFQTWQAAVATGGMYELEYRFRRASDRSYRWHLGRATPVRDESGKVVKWFGTCTDIHDWKLTQEALRQKDAQFRILTETLPQIVWTAGADGHVDYFNPRWRSLTGLPEVYDDEAWLSVLHPDDRDRCVEHWRLSVRTGEPYEIEYRIFEQASGAYRWHLGRALPLRDESGKVTRWFGSCTDIDDHKRAAEKLEAAVAERTASLRQAINQMEEFSYSVSHDLRAPLRAIEGYSGMIFKKYADGADAELAHCVRRISENSARMQRLINDVLQLSRVGRIEAKLQPFHLKSIISEVIEQNTQFQPPQATVIVGNLHSVIGNDVLLSQVLTNLLGNAVKFVKPGIHPIVRVHSELRGGTVRVWVTDNGIGIPAEYQDKLFGMFERLNQNPSYEGTGIGLVIVRKAVERMGGAVGLDPEAEVGSRFWFELKGA